MNWILTFKEEAGDAVDDEEFFWWEGMYLEGLFDMIIAADQGDVENRCFLVSPQVVKEVDDVWELYGVMGK